MIQCSKYVDMTSPQFKDKSDLQIWMNLSPELQQWVAVNHICEVIHNSILELGEKVGSAVIAMMEAKSGTK